MSKKDTDTKIINRNKRILKKRLMELNHTNKTKNTDIWAEWMFIKQATVADDDEDVDDDYNEVSNWNTHKYSKEDCKKGKDLKLHYKFCLCSKYPLQKLMLMENVRNRQRCIIGSCCIKKFGSEEIKRDVKVKLGEAEGKRYCQICKIKLRDDWEKEYHDTCYEKMRIEKKIGICLSCECNLPRHYPDWRRYCNYCYRQLKMKEENVCLKCKKPKDSPKWKKYCDSCWFKWESNKLDFDNVDFEEV